jgi:hypothetical protein
MMASRPLFSIFQIASYVTCLAAVSQATVPSSGSIHRFLTTLTLFSNRFRFFSYFDPCKLKASPDMHDGF